jgi:hypothetical protein
MKKYYWLVAGVVIGIYSVLTAYMNYKLVMPVTDGVFGGIGIPIVIANYAALALLLGLGQDFFDKKRNKK